MKFEGTETINAGREKVWEFLIDPNAVGECVPGLKSMEIIEPDKKFRGVAAIGLGSMKATFTGDVEWVELNAPEFARAQAHGTAPGSAGDVTAEMRLIEQDGATELQWSAEVAIVGTIASLAARLMNSAAKKLTGQFFKCVKKKVEE